MEKLLKKFFIRNLNNLLLPLLTSRVEVFYFYTGDQKEQKEQYDQSIFRIT